MTIQIEYIWIIKWSKWHMIELYLEIKYSQPCGSVLPTARKAAIPIALRSAAGWIHRHCPSGHQCVGLCPRDLPLPLERARLHCIHLKPVCVHWTLDAERVEWLKRCAWKRAACRQNRLEERPVRRRELHLHRERRQAARCGLHERLVVPLKRDARRRG